MKSKIYYTAVGFPKRCLNSPANSVNWIEINRVNLIRAMIACSDRRQIILHGSEPKSIKNYFASKISMIDAFLKFDTNLCTSSLFSTLVSDERRIFSFNLGMALTKLYAEHVCNIPFLYDVSFLENHKLYGKKHSLKFNGTKRPDFIGLDGTGQWAVFESKGLLSNAFYNDINKLTNPAFEDTFLKVFRDKIAEATTQAISITHVGKQKIDINSVSINSITHERV
ncbi:hypothetical protein FMH12_19475, partial [Vibrio cholerae]|nr:hypothetical protein [Vibrio cholerae]